MTNDEAVDILAFLCAGFPNMTLEPKSAEVWVKLMAELDDAEQASLVAIDYARKADRFPSFSDFRRTYLTFLKLKDSGQVVKRMELAAGPKLQEPDWVRMWRHLREYGVFKAFHPSQEAAYRALGYEWPPEEGVVTTEELQQWLIENPPGQKRKSSLPL